MSIAILGGLDRMKRVYEKTGTDFGYKVKCYSQSVPNLTDRLAHVNGIVILTGTVGHRMVREAVKAAKRYKIPVERSHSSGITGLTRCLQGMRAIN